MNREFLVNVIFLVLINLLIKPFYVFGIERTIQDRVGAETYGLYATLFSFSYLFFIINDFGLQQFNNRTIARHPVLLGKYFPRMLAVKLMLGFVYLCVVFAAAWLRGFDSGVFYLLFFIAINHLLISVVAFLRSNISGVGRYRTDSALSALDKLLLSIICGVLLWGLPGRPEFRIEWFVHAQNASWFITALFALLIIRSILKNPIRLKPRLLFGWSVMKSAAPYALAIFLMTAYTRLDMVILEWMLPDGRHETGIYAAAYRLLDAFNVAGLLFAGLLLPMYARLLRQREKEQLKQSPAKAATELSSLVKLALQLIWVGTIPLALACFFFREELMLWLYPRTATPYYGSVLAAVILSLIPFSGTFIISTLLTANDSLKRMNWLFTIGIALNILLNVLLIPQYKAVGAGVATLFTQSLVFGAHIWLTRKILHLPRPEGGWQVLHALLFGLAVGAMCFAFQQWNGLHWLWRFVFAGATGLLLAFPFGMLKLKRIVGFLRGF